MTLLEVCFMNIDKPILAFQEEELIEILELT